MQALGYDRYAVFGEDVGAGISEQLCLDAGDRVLGSIAATDPGSIATQYTPPTDHLTDEEREHHERLKDARTEDFGYLALQTTRPAQRRLRPHRLPHRPGDVDRREVPGVDRPRP